MPHAVGDHDDAAAQHVSDLFLRVVVFRQATAGLQLGDHLIHRFAGDEGLAANAGHDVDPWRCGVVHGDEVVALSCLKTSAAISKERSRAP